MFIIANVVDARWHGEGRGHCRPGFPGQLEHGGWIARDRYPAGRGVVVRVVRDRGGKALRLDSGMNAAMGQIYAGYGGDDLKPDGEGPRPRRLDAGFAERPGRLYRPAAGEEFAAIVNSTTRLHSRVQPCSGWRAKVRAAARSGAPAGGHGG